MTRGLNDSPASPRGAAPALTAAAGSKRQALTELEVGSTLPEPHDPPATSGPEPELADKVLQQFRILLKAVKAHFQQVERATGVGGAQVWALSVIRDRPGIGVGALSRALSVQQPTASILVRNLVQQRLIEARRHERDRRAVELHALPAGQQLLERAPAPLSGRLPGALAVLDGETLRRMHADLARLIAVLGEDALAGMTPLDRL